MVEHSTLTLWDQAVKGAPAIVVLCVAVIVSLGAFIKYLMKLIEKRHDEMLVQQQQFRDEMRGMNERSTRAIEDNTEAVRELRAAISDARRH